MGSAALYHSARRGARVLGLEQFDIPHSRGSSHGLTRIIRLAYWEHPSYVPLLQRAYALWRDLEHRAGERLLVVNGSVDAGAEDSRPIVGGLQACADFALPHDRLDARQLASRFPGYHLPPDIVAVFQPDGGFLLAEQCLLAHLARARSAGADLRFQESVVDWTVDAGGVEVRTSRDTYRARRL